MGVAADKKTPVRIAHRHDTFLDCKDATQGSKLIFMPYCNPTMEQNT
jgi:hypothetical protein